MAYLNIIQPPTSLPAVRGLSGLGDVNFGLQQWLGSLRGEPGSDAAVGCGSNGSMPCTTPEDAANMAYIMAAQLCQEEAFGSDFPGYVADSACADNGKAAADAIYPEALAFFKGLDPSVWATEAANAASGNPYGASTYNYFGGSPTLPTYTQSPNPQSPSQISQYNAFVAGRGPMPAPAVPASSPAASPLLTPASATSPAAAVASSPVSAPVSSGFDLSFLTGSLFSGVPNWVLLSGGALLLFMMGGKR